MKTILIICFALVITTGAAAQKYGGRHYYRPRVSTYVGIGTGYYPYYSPFYSPYYYPYYGEPYYARPTKLEMQIADIKSDYNDRIWSARHDKSLSLSARKKEIRSLKSERDKAVRDAAYNYHRRSSRVTSQ